MIVIAQKNYEDISKTVNFDELSSGNHLSSWLNVINTYKTEIQND